MSTPTGDGLSGLPRASVREAVTILSWRDRLVALATRLNIRRMHRTVAPGLYRIGEPGPDAPVLVTANYRLSFDAVRSSLTGIDAWLLVIDTKGINVWCAAGKDLFTSITLSKHVLESGLTDLVTHRRLVAPQLAATGVAAHEVRAFTGFNVVWGPVRAADIPRFLDNGMKASPEMRRVTFSPRERLAITGVELSRGWQPRYVAALALVIAASGVGAWGFSAGALMLRGGATAAAVYAGLFAGALLMPLLLPVLPFRAFAAKGALTGAVAGLAVFAVFAPAIGWPAAAAVALACVVISSAVAMDLTGASPITSPSGVLVEMRRALPWQFGGAAVALIVWVATAFSRGVM